MNRRPAAAGFTLIELLVATGVLVLIVAFAAQMTTATLSTVSNTSNRLDGSEGVRAASRLLRDELAGVLASKRSGRYLNLLVKEDEDSVALYFTVPRSHTSDLSRIGFVSHVAYVWDRETRVLARAEYHSSREPESVLSTARSEDGADNAANLSRLREITPAYKGQTPYAWTSQPFWEELLAQAKRTPLIRRLENWEIECIENLRSDEKTIVNAWNDPEKLPAAIRVTFTVRSQEQAEKSAGTSGRRYSVLIPLSCAEPELGP